MRIRRATLTAVAAVAVTAAIPASALAGKAKVISMNLPTNPQGVTLACVNVDIPFMTQPFSFQIGNLVFSYDPTGSCTAPGSGGGTPAPVTGASGGNTAGS